MGNTFDEGIWLISFVKYNLGYIDLEETVAASETVTAASILI
nr:hypothetical protein [Pararhizobium sp. IMCC3301]